MADFTFVQSKAVNAASGTSHAVVLASGPTEKNLLVASTECGTEISTVTPPAGWLAARTDDNDSGTYSVGIWYKIAAAGESATVTFTTSGSTTFSLCVTEWGTAGLVAALDRTTGNDPTGGMTSISAGSLTPSGPRALMVAAAAQGAGNGSSETIDSDYTIRENATLQRLVTGDKVKTDETAENPSLAWFTSQGAVAVHVCFRVTVGPRVELGLGSTWKTPDAEIVWYDATSDVRYSEKVSTTRGRRAIQDQFATGSIGLVFNNPGRKYDTLYAAGTYFGQLKPGVPIRVTTTPSGEASKAVARGFVSGFPQRYDLGNTWAFVPISAYGIFDKVARAKLPQSAVDVEVLADVPVAYWKLDDNSEAEMLDSSGFDEHGVYDNPTLGQDPLVADNGRSVFFEHVGDHRGKRNSALLPTTFPATFECWVLLPERDLTVSRRIMGVQRDTAFGSSVDLWVYTSVGGSPNGEAIFEFRGLGSFWKRRGSTRIDDGLTHHLLLSMTDASTISLYVDGVAETLTTISGTAGGAWPGHRQWCVGNVLDTKFGDYGIAGVVDNVAVYASALSAARVLEHYNAGTAPWDGDTTDERLDKVLDIVGLPADRRDFQACTTILGSTVLGQQRALDYMRLVEQSEDGRLFETADGQIRFLDRYWGLTDSHATASQQTFSDLTGVSYSDLEIDPDDELLVNVATITREGGAALTIRNQSSIDVYGEADTSISVLLQTDAEARSLAEHVVLVRGTPAERVSLLRVPLHKYTGAQQAAILDLEIGYRVTVARTPQGVGSAMSLALIIEGVNHTIDTFEHWVEFNVSVVHDDIVALWGSGLWGSGLWGW